jgi:hypothetical protein
MSREILRLGKAFKIGGPISSAIIGQFYTAIDIWVHLFAKAIEPLPIKGR